MGGAAGARGTSGAESSRGHESESPSAPAEDLELLGVLGEGTRPSALQEEAAPLVEASPRQHHLQGEDGGQEGLQQPGLRGGGEGRGPRRRRVLEGGLREPVRQPDLDGAALAVPPLQHLLPERGRGQGRRQRRPSQGRRRHLRELRGFPEHLLQLQRGRGPAQSVLGEPAEPEADFRAVEPPAPQERVPEPAVAGHRGRAGGGEVQRRGLPGTHSEGLLRQEVILKLSSKKTQTELRGCFLVHELTKGSGESCAV